MTRYDTLTIAQSQKTNKKLDVNKNFFKTNA